MPPSPDAPPEPSLELPRTAREAGRDRLAEIALAVEAEWLATDGHGGYASATVCGALTRRYHGLLVADVGPPVGRAVLLAKLDDWVESGGARADLAVNEFEGALAAEGLRYLAAFRLDPLPTFHYEVLGARLKKEIALPGVAGCVVVTYRHAGGPRVTLGVRPLLACRGYHYLAREPAGSAPPASLGDRRLVAHPHPAIPPVTLAWHGRPEVRFDARPDYWRRFRYRVERDRGLDSTEDLYTPGALRVELGPNDVLHVVCALDPGAALGDPEALRQKARARPAASLAPGSDLAGDFVGEALAQAGDAFVVRRRDGRPTVLAGYPWFTEWGRDAMIALPGLLLATGRDAEAREVLATFAGQLSEGMIPNRVPDGAVTPEYNTVDATLWFVEALRATLTARPDPGFARQVAWPAVREIVARHVAGTRFGIRVDADGLLVGGAPDVQLTWMDAKVGDWVVTPRRGKPVEVQALWYNALRVAEALARLHDEPQAASQAAALADRARASFDRAFWLPARGHYADVLPPAPAPPDETLRPNQLLALSLAHPIAPDDHGRQALAACERELLTPVGLRTRARGEGYIGQYRGDPRQRDAAYHQGTVWPWLLGPWADAAVRLDGADGRRRVASVVASLLGRLGEACLGQIAEIYDGDYPHLPRGCIAQAWSVGEVLRIYRAHVRSAPP